MNKWLLLSTLVMLTACSTRQVGGDLSGSTEQRLVTYSIEELINQIPDEDFSHLKGKKIFINSHFIKKNQVLNYAHEMLKLELTRRYQIEIVNSTEKANAELHFFFNSLATDSDTYGLSIPLVNLSDTSQSSQIDILAVDMYHGVAEFMYFIKDNHQGQVIKKRKLLARIKTDKFSTPILNFPISNID